MKTLSKLKLNNLNKVELDELEMDVLKGGASCCCSCWASGSGGSSTSDNNSANTAGGLSSTYGCGDNKPSTGGDDYLVILQGGIWCRC
ncbi:MAG TPA: TIGR04149 family rSAM-modified RiPP [Dysgonomonas sp.]|uniref:TIGR04149 family rSAM-modified RiPP n=1 Tax=Dysgonomonas TaxID=156973 RepID=UPI0025BFDD40|nr:MULTISPECIES: TIGR04149 family rSAM-modified RiPP [Dysgonomonas]MBS5908312.1 TIGR04149 family rSAM-modified RiPP [Dysgonomonas mossii]HML64694.1 TIGR04149 family rSAM-modified RiPP [Dysgonomonas sp.]